MLRRIGILTKIILTPISLQLISWPKSIRTGIRKSLLGLCDSYRRSPVALFSRNMPIWQKKSKSKLYYPVKMEWYSRNKNRSKLYAITFVKFKNWHRNKCLHWNPQIYMTHKLITKILCNAVPSGFWRLCWHMMLIIQVKLLLILMLTTK